MLKIGHISDIHIAEKTKDEAFKALRYAFATFNEEEVDAILISGDLWDGPVQLGDLVNETIEIFKMVLVPIYIIEGTKSHDHPGSVDLFSSLDSEGRIIVLRKPLQMGITPRMGHDYLGTISMLPALTKSYLAKDITASPEEMNQLIQQKLRGILAEFGSMAADKGGKPHILMAHFTVTGCETSTGQVMLGGDVQLSVADIALANADYVAMGHIHKRQKLGSNIYYPGSPYHLNFGELEEKGFNIVTFDDAGELANVEFVKTPSRPRQVIDVHKNGDTWDWSEEPSPDAYIRVRVYAQEHEFPPDMVKQITESYPHCPDIKIEKIPTAEFRVRASEIGEAKSLREKVIKYSKVKDIEIPESALEKADRLEEEVS